MRRDPGRMLPLVVAFAVVATGGVDRKAAKLVRDGNRAYGEGQFDAATELYDEAQTRAPESPEVAYNLGNALCRQGRFAEAAPHLRRAAESKDPVLRERSLYNLGNVLHGARDLQGAAQAYRRALALDPGDRDAKINLEKVLRELEEQRQQAQNQQGGKQGKQDEKQQDGQQSQAGQQNQQRESNQQDDPNRHGDQDEQNAPDPRNQDRPGQEQNRPENSPQDPGDREQQAQVAGLDSVAAGDLSREEAARILQAMREQEKELQRERARLVRARSRRVDKDW